MFDDLNDLYQQVIVEHNRSPRNFKKLAHPTSHADGANPLCGDEIRLEVELDGDRIADIGFQGSGCAISQASASLRPCRGGDSRCVPFHGLRPPAVDFTCGYSPLSLRDRYEPT